MAEVRHRMTAEADQMIRTMGAVNDALAGTAAATQTADIRAKALKLSTTALAGALTAAAAAAVVGTKRAIDHGDALGELAERTGLSTEALSKLTLAAEFGDTSLEALGVGLKALSNGLVDAYSKGAGPAAEAFADLGIATKDAAGKMRPLEAVLFDASDALASMEDGALKTALAQDLFGKGAQELIPLLNQGAAGLRKNAELAEDLGLVWSEDAAGGASDFNDAISTLRATATGFFDTAVRSYLPTLTAIAEGAALAARAILGMSDAQEAGSDAARATANKAVEAQNEQIELLRAQVKEAEAFDKVLSAAQGQQVVSEQTTALNAELTKQIEVLHRLRSEVGAELGMGEQLREDIGQTVAARREQRLAALAAGEAAKEAAKMAVEAAKAEADATDEAVDRIIEARRRQQERAERQAQEDTNAVQLIVRNRRTEAEAAEEARIAIEESSAARLASELAAEETIRAARAESNRSAIIGASAVADGLFSIFAAITNAVIENSTEQGEARKRALLEAFYAEKAAAIAQSVVNTALGVSSAIAANAAQPVVAVLAGIAAGVAGTAATIAIAAKPPPQFHDGGVSDEMIATLRRGEAVLTPQATRQAGGREGIDRLNAGMGVGPSSLTLVQKLSHRVVDVQTAAALRRIGSPLDAKFRATNARGVGRRNMYAEAR